MENKEFSKKLEERTKAFAIRIIKLSTLLPNTVEGRIIRNQLTKAGTSIGVIIVKPTEQEARLILRTKSKSVKANPAKHFTGLKS